MPKSSLPFDIVLPGATVADVRRVADLPASQRPHVGYRFSATCTEDGYFWAGACDGFGRGAVRVKVDATATDTPDGVHLVGTYGVDLGRATGGMRFLSFFIIVVTLVAHGVAFVRGRDVGFFLETLGVGVLIWIFARPIAAFFSRSVGPTQREEMAGYLHRTFDGCATAPADPSP